MARFGVRFDAQGVLAGSKDANRCIGYLTKYLTKQVATATRPTPTPSAPTPRGWPRRCDISRARRGAQLAAVRHPAQERPARPGPGRCKGKAHDADHLGYAGRRVLVSRKWSGKTLADHRADRKDWLLRTLGVSATDPARYAWEPVAPSDPDHMDHARRLLHAVADRLDGKPRSMRLGERRACRIPTLRLVRRRRDESRWFR